ncbi:bifunctional diaminohydroxyphosphoribosylaminopyrimidine deaminase/5-amino-6-(5-phosphoribosylamino)uracil reductase RibD [Evansella sp. AB-rgal1]|uniref:bifunctional diaminohydroxyphosphoribosylaminopyrimidine deaminase/5-amino-6-(5-phosphoribosylamino)uracil reductase RibD n=1 Tax=Evansella sp. AB-rgal1 TaxID=3242696 RepID=UPI00359EB314
MKMALELAKATEGQTAPNPVVGSVIVKDGQIVGFGAHLRAGEEHAERHALKMAGEKAKGATMYVTLEPCSHFGRTSPCADAVIEAGISKVIIASTDPNPLVAGQGIKKLRDANIETIVGVMREEADKLNDVFFHFIKHKKPFVTLKSATSLDGKIATSIGESQWITSEESRYDAHLLRHIHDAILVGVNTVIADDPSLTTRLEHGGKHPIRIILDTHLRTPVTAKLVTDKLAPTWIITTVKEEEKIDSLKASGVSIILMDEITIPNVLSYLGKHNISSLLVEGGGKINDSFLRSGEFQQVIIYLAPKIIGGQGALSSFSGEGITTLSDAPKLTFSSMKQVGPDLKLTLLKGGD